MKLLVEEAANLEFLTEDVGGKKQYFIEGIFLQSEIENKNGRIYPKNILQKEVDRYIKESINTNRAVGELSHNQLSVHPDPKLISHKIISLKEDGNNFVGKALVLDTPNGKIVKALMEGGVKFGVSSKGLGTLSERNGKKYVSEDYKLSTAADVVFDPSAPDAYITAIMESAEYDINEYGVIYEVQSNIRNAKTKTQLEEAKLNAFKNILKYISK
jgi:hypothetical protein